MTRREWVAWSQRPYLFDKGPLGIWVTYEHPDGSAVLKTQKSWRLINGIGLNLWRRSVWLMYTANTWLRKERHGAR